ncbi:hypothetical protein VF14_17915 [Nostoc linckia z18]|uniref:Uncharacterized protein n=1 Tax=Nostoc linckia z8 TaxID=1628746 RepID=A0A9Q6EL76_NOSLI|nr:hypothetical protein [Nostoc linckia]PHJ60834.1 hypothetical protein VF02_21585 [Nostoc linckia z1]PHJ71763.1 hypothetical protein VF05_07150 [Nostoc linckia z3]PHJ85447.1 hypothetical protein VF07_23710 [Nostoc linckia z6]PHJ86965.1 hypothetical protein VF06_01250 [Nostoc linckia z4]PHK05070.1 hypothetical protein VF09_27310 [Nostoc linckia z9]PHK22567.1 hypothetical protein VF10_16330 [Nostoc linckia z13]PHK33251.1 hypothetical protein VF14_17915 [Nostoc linckia z18]
MREQGRQGGRGQRGRGDEGDKGDKGDEEEGQEAGEKFLPSAPCFLLPCLFPMPHAQCPIPN